VASNDRNEEREDGRDEGDGDSKDRPKPDRPPKKRPVFSTLVSGADARDDHGSGPRYADLASLALQDSDRDLRILVGFDGSLPGRLEEREVMGIGVDLFRGDTSESDYQVFLDGGDDGWFAYLQTPQGFVEFPGTFQQVRDGFVVTVPWRSLGDMRRGSASLFADYSDASRTPARSSEDFLPEEDRLPFAR
jgi:hypothetical protein